MDHGTAEKRISQARDLRGCNWTVANVNSEGIIDVDLR